MLFGFKQVQVFKVYKYNFIKKHKFGPTLWASYLHLIVCTKLILYNFYFEFFAPIEKTNTTPKKKSLIACNLFMKEGCLFVLLCTDEIHWIGMLQIAFLVSLESSWGGRVHWLGFIVFGLVV